MTNQAPDLLTKCASNFHLVLGLGSDQNNQIKKIMTVWLSVCDKQLLLCAKRNQISSYSHLLKMTDRGWLGRNPRPDQDTVHIPAVCVPKPKTKRILKPKNKRWFPASFLEMHSVLGMPISTGWKVKWGLTLTLNQCDSLSPAITIYFLCNVQLPLITHPWMDWMLQFILNCTALYIRCEDQS